MHQVGHRAAVGAGAKELVLTRFADAVEAVALESPKQDAVVVAVMLQKVYKSFRMRRRLADFSVLVEQSWWELLDFV